MTKRLLLLACAGLIVSTEASAQSAPPAATITHGARAPGVCILDMQGAIGGSTVGRSVGTRMEQLKAQVEAELKPERTAIDNEAKALEGQRASLAPAAFAQKARPLQQRDQAWQEKYQQRIEELQATQRKAINRIATELNPIVQTVYQQKGCSLLLQADAVVIADPAMDITASVVTALNGKIQNFSFERERLDTPAGGASPAR